MTPLPPRLLLAAASFGAADFYVAPLGDDAGPGSLARPFATLERARDAVRGARRRNPKCDYSVALRGGPYPGVGRVLRFGNDANSN